MKTHRAFFGAACCVLASFVALPAWATDIVYQHMDIDMDYSGGADGTMSLDFRTYSPMSTGVPTNEDDYSPAGNPIIVPIGNTYTVPSGTSYGCLGSSGSTVYRINITEVSGQVWLGLNTLDIPASTFVNNKVQLELVSVVSAPAGARVVVYDVGFGGSPIYLLNTAGGSCSKTSYSISRNVHSHAYWAFSAAGDYTVRFRVTGTLVAGLGGGTKASSNVDVAFKVQ